MKRQLLPYEERLLNEYNELKEKIVKLKRFIDNYDEFTANHEVIEPKSVFVSQRNTMNSYKEILEARLHHHGIDF